MKLFPRFLLPLLFLSFTLPIAAQSVYQYTESTEDFVNPERGMYRYFETRTAGSYTALDQTTLENLRDQDQQSLIYRIFYLDGFYNGALNVATLNAIDQDFATMRAAGVKAIVRFAYSNTLNYDEEDNPLPPFNDTPDPAILFQHIHQLRPLLIENSDVILTVQNGFYGIWGENYYSDDFGTPYPGPITPPQQTRRNAVTDSLLSILPADRTVSVRYPTLKTDFLGLQIPEDSLTQGMAFQGTDISRIAAHNDCFLADYNDYTFLDTLTEKPYWEAESRYLLMGGESCRDEATYTECTNAVAELARFHWTYLNDDYHPDVLQRWQQEGCYDEVRRKLGYRLVLREATLPDAIEAGKTFSLTLEIENTGWAAPMLPRSVEFVLRSVGGAEEITVPLDAIDLRYCSGGRSFTYMVQPVMPEAVVSGEYEVFLFLPDGRNSLRNDPAYAIRLANQGIWDGTTGLHDLQHSLTLTANSCPENDLISDSQIVSGIYRAENELTVNTEVAAEAAVQLAAGNLVRLTPGFHTLPGSQVSIMIEGCPEPLAPAPAADFRISKTVSQTSDFKVWPNPSTGEVNILLKDEMKKSDEILKAIVSDTYGRIIRQIPLPVNQVSTLNLGDLPRGVYWFSWFDQMGKHTHRLVLQ